MAWRDKCAFMVDSVDYVGHQIDASGLHTLLDKVKAVQEAPHPMNYAARAKILLWGYYTTMEN